MHAEIKLHIGKNVTVHFTSTLAKSESQIGASGKFWNVDSN